MKKRHFATTRKASLADNQISYSADIADGELAFLLFQMAENVSEPSYHLEICK
ncbi:hypothetical protein [Yoonia sp. SS1-5]|uniref:Uncharacterized protein n=1 Tax=Yoonia rhodophyticola TaxID=3137370 RepID=A0AAN0NKV9_9RHOB